MEIQDAHKAKWLLQQHEGLRLKPYRCTSGKLSIGYGRNLDDSGITETEAEFLFLNDWDFAVADAQAVIPSFHRLSAVRQAVLINMAFNLGRKGLATFRRMIGAVENERWTAAGAELLDSRYARQVGGRARQLSRMLTTNRWPDGVGK